MARKAVLEGGKRDEIIAAATELFFANGFENTSVRMVLEKVGGEVGMFYHYFKSKDELFDTVVERFFTNYTAAFTEMVRGCDSIENFVEQFLLMLTRSMGQYRKSEVNMHWTIRCAMHERTLMSLIPVVEESLERFGYAGRYPKDIAAGRIVAELSATIHSASFVKLSETEQARMLREMIAETMGISDNKKASPMLVVADMEKSVAFYREVMGLSVVLDFGANKTLSGGVVLQTLDTYKEFIGTDTISFGGKDKELYFEEDDFDTFAEKLCGLEINYVHPVIEHSWGQRVVRFYDPDQHIIEVGENIKVVCRRFLAEGLTPEQVAVRMDVPLEFVESCR